MKNLLSLFLLSLCFGNCFSAFADSLYSEADAIYCSEEATKKVKELKMENFAKEALLAQALYNDCMDRKYKIKVPKQ